MGSTPMRKTLCLLEGSWWLVLDGTAAGGDLAATGAPGRLGFFSAGVHLQLLYSLTSISVRELELGNG